VARQTRERPEFTGDLVRSPITGLISPSNSLVVPPVLIYFNDGHVPVLIGKLEKHFSRARRLPRYLLSIVVSLSMLSFAVLFMASSLNLQVHHLIENHSLTRSPSYCGDGAIHRAIHCSMRTVLSSLRLLINSLVSDSLITQLQSD
jgi:hypothetical protein